MKTLRKYLLPVSLFCVALALPCRSLAITHQTSHFKFTGLTADASFESFDTSGCVFTTAFLTATNGRNLMPGGPQANSAVFVSLSQFDVCSLTDLLEASGFASLPAGGFQIDKKLTSATLNTSVDVFDFVSSTSFTVEISLSWTGTGGLTVSRVHNLLRQAGLRINASSVGTARQATASGSVTGGGTNYSPLPSSFADLNDSKLGELDVSH